MKHAHTHTRRNLEEGKKTDLILPSSEMEIPKLFSRRINITVGEYFKV